MIDLQGEIFDDLQSLIDLKREIMTIIKCIEGSELQTLLELRYLCCKTWEEIASDVNWSPRQVFYMHGAALREVDRILRCKKSLQ